MHRRDKPRAKPGLAHAHQPFTPITYKPVQPAETPFQPLRVNDLGTPKVNKSDSIGCLVPDAEIVADAEFTRADQDLHALRQAFLSCIAILDRMDKRTNEQVQRRSVCTQTATDTVRPEAVACNRMKPKNDQKKEEDARKPLQFANRVPTETKPEPPQSSLEESSTEDDGNLKERLHEMSLLLKRLENQIGEVNQPYDAAE
jgi:hypothetical protein